MTQKFSDRSQFSRKFSRDLSQVFLYGWTLVWNVAFVLGNKINVWNETCCWSYRYSIYLWSHLVDVFKHKESHLFTWIRSLITHLSIISVSTNNNRDLCIKNIYSFIFIVPTFCLVSSLKPSYQNYNITKNIFHSKTDDFDNVFFLLQTRTNYISF